MLPLKLLSIALLAAQTSSFLLKSGFHRLSHLQSSMLEEALEGRKNPSLVTFEKRKYFYGRAQIELGAGYKTMSEDFSPSWKDEQCALAVVDVPLPLGVPA
jgi:hypothetical protein